MHVYINKQLISSQNCFGVLSREVVTRLFVIMNVSVGNTALCLGQLMVLASYGVSEPGLRELKNWNDMCLCVGGGDSAVA